MHTRDVPGAACPVCASDVVERYVDEAPGDSAYVMEQVLGRSCVNSSCRWRQFSQVSLVHVGRT